MLTLLFPIHWKELYKFIFKVSGCKPFILATLKKNMLKVSQLNFFI